MVKLRLKRYGRTHQPVYRLGAVDSRAKRDGKVIEELGVYDPTFKDDAKQIQFNQERCQHWLNVGAQPSETVADLLRKLGMGPKVEKK